METILVTLEAPTSLAAKKRKIRPLRDLLIEYEQLQQLYGFGFDKSDGKGAAPSGLGADLPNSSTDSQTDSWVSVPTNDAERIQQIADIIRRLRVVTTRHHQSPRRNIPSPAYEEVSRQVREGEESLAIRNAAMEELAVPPNTEDSD